MHVCPDSETVKSWPRFRMNHTARMLEVVKTDDTVLARWPAEVEQWRERDYMPGDGKLKRRQVRIPSEAGWSVTVTWGVFSLSSNHQPLDGESWMETISRTEGFDEEPHLVEVVVADQKGPVIVDSGTDFDTIVPYVSGGVFICLMHRAGEFFSSWDWNGGPPVGAVLGLVDHTKDEGQRTVCGG